MKKIIVLSVLVSFLIGCSGTYIAKAPTDVFVTKGDLTKAYTPIAAIQSKTMAIYLFGIGSVPLFGTPKPEDQLNDVINKMLVPQARKLGANAIIGLEYDVTLPCFPFMLYRINVAKGMAVKTK